MVSVGGHVDIVCASIYVKILQLTSFAATFQKISLIWELHPLTAMDLINTPFCREIFLIVIEVLKENISSF